MLAGLYTAGSGIEAALKQQSMLANDAANELTPGFAALLPVQGPWLPTNVQSSGPGGMTNLGVVPEGARAGTALLTSPGTPEPVSDPLAGYLQSANQFFGIRTAAGVRYTRSGYFLRSGAGLLVSAAGDPVLDPAGNQITVPPGARMVTGGRILGPTGNVVGAVGVWTSTGVMTTQGGGLFTGGVRATAPTILPGHVAGSNVSLAETTVELIASQRALTAAAQAVQAENSAAKTAEGVVG